MVKQPDRSTSAGSGPLASSIPAQSLEDRLQERRQKRRQQVEDREIAIVGMAGRFPGANTLEAFWQNLAAGVESITRFTPEDLQAAGVPVEQLQEPNYVPASPVLDDVAGFDAAFFGYSPQEAQVMDPQHRLFLESCWQGLETAGYDPFTFPGLIGVFGGCNISTYLLSFFNNPHVRQLNNDYQLMIGNDKDSLTTTVSYKLNLKGPSYAVQTFCSTSLVAVHLACQSLRAGECDLALAGGVSIRVPTVRGYLYEEGGQESPDGHCRSFDAQARGTLFGDGVGVVVLKRLSEALADGDPIVAVLKGSATNNDGAVKVSYTAPSVGGQAQVVQAALQDAEVSAESIQYVEAHGTATALGDPIEVASLTRAYRQQTERVGYCALGSVKSNIGHLDRASGISGLLKVALALHHRRLPASLHYQQPNPAIDFARSPFVVNQQTRAWPEPEQGRMRRAGVNSLGMGGTNVHVIVEEAPAAWPTSPGKSSYLLPLSARTPEALTAMTQRLQQYLEEQGAQEAMADVAYTLQVGRHAFGRRRVVLWEQGEQAAQVMGGWQAEGMAPEQEQRVVYLLGGMGEQAVGMGRELYEQEEVFRGWVDRGADVLEPLLGVDMRELLYGGEQSREPAGRDLRAMVRGGAAESAGPAEQLSRTRYGQPVLFVLSYALARQLEQWGIEPIGMLGYSLGEYVAATLAGVWTWEEGVRLVARRAVLLEEQGEGRLLAVPLGREEVREYMGEQVWLAADGGQGMSILGGSVEAIERVQKRLEAEEIVSRQVQARQAFHTPLVAGASEGLRAELGRIELAAPRVPYISNVTGRWIKAEEAMDREYWVRQMSEPAQLGRGLEQVQEVEESVVLEVGMGQMLSGLLRQAQERGKGEGKRQVVLASQGSRYEAGGAREHLLKAVGQLWVAGVALKWERAYGQERRQRLMLPTYPFEHISYWIEPPAQLTTSSADASPTIDNPVDKIKRIEDLSDWFFVPSWKRSISIQPFDLDILNEESKSNWLVFIDDCGIGQKLAEALRIFNQNVITVSPGTAFVQRSDLHYEVRPDESTDYSALLKTLKVQGFEPQKVAHCWLVTDDKPPMEGQTILARTLRIGFHSLLALTQALTAYGLDETHITIISTNMQSVIGNEQCSPEKATLIGPCKVIPQEHPDMACRSVDICLPAPGELEMLVQQLLGELINESDDTFVALRLYQRWVQIVEPIRLSARLEQQAKNFRPQGVYLITGGMGGIGLAIATYLAQTVQARLVLVGRTALPESEHWSELLETLDLNDDLRYKLQCMQHLKALGSEVVTFAADVANEEVMREIIRCTVATFGTIHGVIHAAAVPPSGLIQMKTPEMAMAVLAPKVQGLLTLERVLRGYDLDFLILFSSMSSFTGGGPGQVDYCAANAFLDAYARCNATRYRKIIAIDWGEWQWDAWAEGLLGFPEVLQQYFRDVRKKFGITFEEGLEALNRILSRNVSQVVVATQDFVDMVEGSKHFSTRTLIDAVKMDAARSTHQGHAASFPSQAGISLRVSDDPVEQKIAEIWIELLGTERPGLHASFFALGGHSLMGLQLMSRLRATFQVHLPFSLLFEAPTIAELALEIKLMLIDTLEQMDDDEAEKLVEDNKESLAPTF